MPDMTPVGNTVNYNPQAGVQNLSGLLGIAQGAQALQTGKYQQQTAAAIAQQQRITAQGAAGVNQFFTQWQPGDHIGPDGTIDIDSAHQSDAYAGIPGVAKLAVDQKLLDLKKGQIDNMQSMATLDNNTINDAARRAYTLASDPDVKEDYTDPETGINKGRAIAKNFWQNYSKLGAEQAKIGGIFGTMGKDAPPGQLAPAFKAFGAQAQTVSEQQPKQMVVNRGNVSDIYNVAPTGLEPNQQPAASVTMGTAPGVTTGPNSSIIAYSGAPSGVAPTYRTLSPGGGGAAPQGQVTPATNPFGPSKGKPWTAQDTQPPANAPKNVQDAYSASTQAAQGDVLNARVADKDYGINLSLADNIRRLSKANTSGPGSDTWNSVAGWIGTRFGANNISGYQELGAFLENQALRLQGQMGLPNTNAGLQGGQTIGGKPSYQPQAIQDKNDYLEALTEGFHQYRAGLDRVEQYSGQANPQAVNAFKGAWVANYDPRIYEGEQAHARGEGGAFMKTLTPQDAAILAKKRANLQKLAAGEMP